MKVIETTKKRTFSVKMDLADLDALLAICQHVSGGFHEALPPLTTVKAGNFAAALRWRNDTE